MTPGSSEVWAAASTLRGDVKMTPVRLLAGPDVLVKCESEQVGGSFKIRGALSALSSTPGSSVVTGSSGNHGIALARAASLGDANATVYMSHSSAPHKRSLIREAGGAIVLCDGGNSRRDSDARAFARLTGARYVSSHDDPDVIVGQGTVALEILEQVPGVTDIYVPVGGGGLLAGTCLATRRSGVRVVGVEPAGASRFALSLRAGRRVPLGRVATVCDGVRAQVPGELAYACSRTDVDHMVAVRDSLTENALAMLGAAGIAAEITGALALAGLLADRRAGPVPVAVISGSNARP